MTDLYPDVHAPDDPVGYTLPLVPRTRGSDRDGMGRATTDRDVDPDRVFLPDTGVDEGDIASRVTPSANDARSTRDENTWSLPLGIPVPSEYQEPATTNTVLRRYIPLAGFNLTGGATAVVLSEPQGVKPGTQIKVERLIVQAPATSGAVSVYRNPMLSPADLIEYIAVPIPAFSVTYPTGLYLLEYDQLTLSFANVPVAGGVVALAQCITIPLIA